MITQNKAFKFIRKWTQCVFGVHWNIVYDNGIPNDLVTPGTCLDCGYRSEGINWPKSFEVKRMKCIECGKEIQGPGICVNSDGDFTCNHICKHAYEQKSEFFLNEVILNDSKFRKWLD